MSVVTLGGMPGGGARVIGPLIAARIGGDYVDRHLLLDVARQVGSTVEVIHEMEQNPSSFSDQWKKLFQRVLERSSFNSVGGDPYFGPGVTSFLTEEYEDIQNSVITSEHQLSDDHYVDALHETIVRVASEGNVVMVGRGAHLVLKDMDSVLRVGIVCDLEDRIKRVMKLEHLSEDTAELTIRRRDKARSQYFKKVFNVEDGDKADLFHLTINTSKVDIEFATDVIVDALQLLKQGQVVANLKSDV